MSKVALEYRDVFAVAKIDVNDYPVKTAEYHVRLTSTFILFYKGKIVTAIVRPLSKKSLLNRILEGLTAVIEPPLTEE